MAKKLVNTSPHITDRFSTRGIMTDVIIALIPATIAGVIFFGLYPLLMTILSIGTCVATEYLWNKARKKPCTLKDGSAVVTGLILALNLPPYVPFYIPILGGAFAISLVKMLFGGLGRNFANPAATARVMLLLSYSSVMTRFFAPNIGTLWFYPAVDAVASATPLAGAITMPQLMAGLIGNTAGSFGETSAIALLVGGIYLIVRKVINWKIPFVVIFGSIGFSVLFGLNGVEAIGNVLFGGMMIGAFFMATDYASSPNTETGKIIYALFIALITVLVRTFGAYPEGMSFAIVLANIIVPLLDKYLVPKSFGDGKDVCKIVVSSVTLAFIAITFVIALVSFVGVM